MVERRFQRVRIREREHPWHGGIDLVWFDQRSQLAPVIRRPIRLSSVLINKPILTARQTLGFLAVVRRESSSGPERGGRIFFSCLRRSRDRAQHMISYLVSTLMDINASLQQPPPHELFLHRAHSANRELQDLTRLRALRSSLCCALREERELATSRPGLVVSPIPPEQKVEEKKKKLSKELTIFSQELSRSRLRDLINDLDFAQRLVLDFVIRHELFEICDERLFAARSIRRPRRRRDDISYTRQKDQGREPKGFSSREPSCVFSFSFLPFGASPLLSSGMPMTATSCTSGCDNR